MHSPLDNFNLKREMRLKSRAIVGGKLQPTGILFSVALRPTGSKEMARFKTSLWFILYQEILHCWRSLFIPQIVVSTKQSSLCARLTGIIKTPKNINKRQIGWKTCIRLWCDESAWGCLLKGMWIIKCNTRMILYLIHHLEDMSDESFAVLG